MEISQREIEWIGLTILGPYRLMIGTDRCAASQYHYREPYNNHADKLHDCYMYAYRTLGL